MQYQSQTSPVSSSLEQIERHIPLAGSVILELGCGAASTTRSLAEAHPDCHFIATEVDPVQHKKNLASLAIPNLVFQFGGAEQIELPDGSVDAVIMLKSLHHVPTGFMAQALGEIHRVLRPEGLAYISEPVYAGAFNEIGAMFNDEKVCREVAFEQIRASISANQFELVQQIFFDDVRIFHGFEEYRQQVLGQTHLTMTIDDRLHGEIRAAFERHLDERGIAEFRCPQRVDLLRRNIRG